jgi:hypothetical protein
MASAFLWAHRRKFTVLCSVSVGTLVTAPAFAALREASLTPRPPHADLCLGSWEGSDADGEPAFLRFNKWSMADLDTDGERARGPVTFSDAEFRVGPLPLPLLRDGPARHVRVEQWPTRARPDEMRAAGVTWRRTA